MSVALPISLGTMGLLLFLNHSIWLADGPLFPGRLFLSPTANVNYVGTIIQGMILSSGIFFSVSRAQDLIQRRANISATLFYGGKTVLPSTKCYCSVPASLYDRTRGYNRRFTDWEEESIPMGCNLGLDYYAWYYGSYIFI